jgi:cephalosporin hydroxylase
MKSFVAILLLGPFALFVLGTSTVHAADTTETESPYAKEVAEYERAMGADHRLSDEEIHEQMQGFMTNPVFQNRFLGILTLQTPSDAWIILEIMAETRPDLIVEAGTFHGGSAALWAIILQHINPRGRVITIDIEDQREARAINLPISKRRVEFILGSSTDPKVVAKVHKRAKGKRVMVLLDSLHSKEHVAAEIEAYAPLVPVGGYLIVQDTSVGPDEAIAEFLAANTNWVADRRRERYPDTNSVKGYLRRIKP